LPLAAIWSDRDRAQIAEMLLAGKSMRLIGAAFGINRNQVIGRVHRDQELHRLIGKQYSAVKMQREKPPKPRQKTIPPLKVMPVTWRHPGKPDIKGGPAGLPAPSEPSGMRLVPLIGLRAHECRFAIGEDRTVIGGFLFCGRAAPADDVYCREHRAIASPGRRGDE
jgi:hypothetical protein